MKWKPQETPFTCAPSALRNCLIFLNIYRTEKYIRYLMGTTKNGTSEKGILKCVGLLKLDYHVFLSKSFNTFRKNLLKCLKSGNPCILLIDACNHWVAAIKYEKRKIIIIDSEFKTIFQSISLKNLKSLAYNFDKLESRGYYYFIEIKKKNIF